MSPPDSHSGMQPVMPEKVEKAIKVGEKGDVRFDIEKLVGDLRLKPGRYQIQHRTDSPDHSCISRRSLRPDRSGWAAART
jgi:hypothetical protein